MNNINQEEVQKQIENNTVVLYNLKDKNAFYTITPEEARFAMDAIKERRENNHYCQIISMNKQNWWKKGSIQKGIYMVVQHISNLQLAYKDYYAATSVERRGGISNDNETGDIFDIAINPRPEEGKESNAIKLGFLSVLKEKIYNDLTAYSSMILKLVNDKIISEESSKEAEIEQWEIAAKLLWHRKGRNMFGFEDLSKEEKRKVYEKWHKEEDYEYEILREKVKSFYESL